MNPIRPFRHLSVQRTKPVPLRPSSAAATVLVERLSHTILFCLDG